LRWIREWDVLVSVLGKSGEAEEVLMSYETAREDYWFPKPLEVFVVASAEKARNRRDSGAHVRRSEVHHAAYDASDAAGADAHVTDHVRTFERLIDLIDRA
jgi:hypothetical protein